MILSGVPLNAEPLSVYRMKNIQYGPENVAQRVRESECQGGGMNLAFIRKPGLHASHELQCASLSTGS